MLSTPGSGIHSRIRKHRVRCNMRKDKLALPQHWFVEILGLILLIGIIPLWPAIVIIVFIVKYRNLNVLNKNPFKIFLYTLALTRKVALDEYTQYRNRKGPAWDERTEHWMPWSYRVKYPLLIIHCFVILVLTSFISDKITKETTIEELFKMYLL